ncbi:hypothetical protein B0H11DRAFT_81384 [Mycena galericulata]|nr:hypothetical protein B0H11DRAFT_81384 [Mycena galericulata]
MLQGGLWFAKQNQKVVLDLLSHSSISTPRDACIYGKIKWSSGTHGQFHAKLSWLKSPQASYRKLRCALGLFGVLAAVALFPQPPTQCIQHLPGRKDGSIDAFWQKNGDLLRSVPSNDPPHPNLRIFRPFWRFPASTARNPLVFVPVPLYPLASLTRSRLNNRLPVRRDSARSNGLGHSDLLTIFRSTGPGCFLTGPRRHTPASLRSGPFTAWSPCDTPTNHFDVNVWYIHLSRVL